MSAAASAGAAVAVVASGVDAGAGGAAVADGGDRAFLLSVAAGVIRPQERLTPSQWAERHRGVAAESSHRPGPWRNDVTPYLVDIMDAAASGLYSDVVVIKCSQVGATEAAINVLFACIDNAPGPAMVVYPSTDFAREQNRKRLIPAIRATPRIKNKLKNAGALDGKEARIADLTIGQSTVFLRGTRSDADLKSLPIRYLIGDEVEEWSKDAWELACERTKTFKDAAVRMAVSTPGAADQGIDRLYKQGDQRTYHVPCPHCGEYRELSFEQLDWEGKDRDDVDPLDAEQSCVYVCECCGAEIDEKYKAAMMRRGVWVKKGQMVKWSNGQMGEGEGVGSDEASSAPPGQDSDAEASTGSARQARAAPVATSLGPFGAEDAFAFAWERREAGGERAGVVGEGPRTRVASFSISGMYSPWTTWASLVHDYVKLGKNPPDKWWAGMLGRATQAVGRSIEPGSMKAHCLSLADGGYRRGTVPRGCLALFAGVDVQADRIYYVVRGFGAEGRSSWLIDYGALEAGDRHALVGAIERVKSRRYPLVDGHELAGLQGLRYTLERPEGMIERVGLPIIDLAVDSGDRTSEVYAACDQTGAQAAKGMSESRPGLVNFRMSQIGGAGRGAAGRAAPRLLLMVGGSYYKTMIVGHMAAAPPTAARDGSDRLSIEADKQRWWWPAYTADRTEPGGTVRRGDNHDRYWHQVTAERQVVATDRYGRAMAVWELREGRKDNHLLDCEVYACAIADRNEVRTFTRQMAVELYQEERG